MVGLPIAMVDNQNLPIKRWLDNANFPITIIQHTHDPLGSFSEVERIISEVNRDINFLEIPGDSHDYNEFLLFTDILEGLRKAT
ncbi:MAG TPA: hypothetical protein VFN31_00435 [Candidatus Saccharimonadales bacterium]|nr:hypothetical protein [Candidatus Saccharimonadales bacterium]